MKINEILTEAKSAHPQQAAKAIAMKKAGIKPKNESAELEQEFDLIESIINRLAQHNGVDAEVIWEDLETLTEDELYAFAVTSEPIMESQGMAEGSLNEFAIPGGGDGDSGRWYNDDELADIIGDDWFEDFDVSNDGFNIDAYGEKAKKNLVGYANTWFDDKGYNVNVMGVEHNDVDHDLQWYIVGSFHNPRFANEGVAEGQADQVKKIVKKNGKPVGEIGTDPEASPGNGNWYVKHYASGYDVVGFDNAEEALAELKHCMKQGVAEERTETKNEKGEVTSWRDESDWRKVSKEKDGRGRVTNLSDKARRETEKLKKEKSVDEGWKSALGGAALAGAMALGGSGAHAQSTPSGEDFLPEIVAHVTFKVDGNTVTKDINLGNSFKSPGQASAALEKFLKSKGIKFYEFSIERVKPKNPDYLEKTPASDTGHSGSMDSGPYSASGSSDNYMAKESIDEAVDRAAKSMMEDGYEFKEGWSRKYKSSINCSHPKGFSQKAHCAGKKKHNESIEMEMVCEDCGMCESHGNLNEIAKGAKDSNGVTKCWPGKHAEGTKKGRNGGQVRNCVPNESVEEEAKHGLYYNVNKRKKAGTSRPASSPKAPTAQAWKDAAKTAKNEDITESMTPDEQFDMIEHMVESLALARGVDAEQIWEDLESFDDTVLLAESAAWRRKEGKSKKGGLNAKGVASYRRENPGSKLQTAVTTKPSKLKPGSKAAKRRKSFCARMSGVKGPAKKPNGKPTRKTLALRKWNC